MTVISNEEFSLRRGIRSGSVTPMPKRESIFDTFRSAFGSEEKAKEALLAKHEKLALNWLKDATDELGPGPPEEITRMLHERASIAKEFANE